MQLNDYQILARRTAKQMPLRNALIHGALGIGSDMGELVTLIKAHTVYGKPLDALIDEKRPEKGTVLDGIREEAGDVKWFIAYTVDQLKFKMGDLFEYQPFAASVWKQLHTLEEWGMLAIGAAGRINLDVCAGVPRETPKELIWELSKAYVCLENIVRHVGLDMHDVDIHNLQKLRKRYPDKYTDELTITRLDKQS